MARESGEFQISELLRMTATNKYAAAVAAFEVVDNVHMLDLPAKWATRKAGVQAMMAIAREFVQFDFVSDEQRAALEDELQKSPHRDSAEALFRSPVAAPVLSDSEDDLEEIGEIIDERMDGVAEETEGGEGAQPAAEAETEDEDFEEAEEEGGDDED